MAVWPVSIFSRWLKTLQCSCASNNFLSPRMLFLCYNCTHLSLSMTLFPPSVYALTLPISILPFLLHFPHKEPFGLSLLFSCWFPPSLPHSLPLVNVPRHQLHRVISVLHDSLWMKLDVAFNTFVPSSSCSLDASACFLFLVSYL